MCIEQSSSIQLVLKKQSAHAYACSCQPRVVSAEQQTGVWLESGTCQQSSGTLWHFLDCTMKQSIHSIVTLAWVLYGIHLAGVGLCGNSGAHTTKLAVGLPQQQKAGRCHMCSVLVPTVSSTCLVCCECCVAIIGAVTTTAAPNSIIIELRRALLHAQAGVKQQHCWGLLEWLAYSFQPAAGVVWQVQHCTFLGFVQ